MQIADLATIEGRRYPAQRRTQTMAGPGLPVPTESLAMGYVTLDPKGGQVPWHNQDMEEVYFVLDGRGEMCLGEERQEVHGGQMVYIPPGLFHQLTNIGDEPLHFIYCYAPPGEIAHWKQELTGTLPVAGKDVPPLPEGAWPQCTEAPETIPEDLR